MPRVLVAVTMGAGVVLATWLPAPAAPTPRAPDVPEEILAEITAAAPLAAEVEQQTAQLRAKLATPVQPPSPRRDPFRFGTPRTPADAPTPTPPFESTMPADVPAMPSIEWPTLTAIVADSTESTRTAVVSLGDLLEFLDAGQSFQDFVVVSIATGSIELRHEPTRTTKTLSLR